ncbi:hypothetical protein V8B55DRAFT_1378888 [Mucor lusitanicus]|uniref:Cyclin N-terminal domain-containing protein n=1 Tax=Mucor circinelloides f. lusitanicus TaxID=29924 RepID=A0A8H4BID6_MUCCL|nr:hypothetical protein FB192DRAFT_1114851 [Mucor lusitanicus]
MTSLLPLQYVTPHSITSTSASSVVESNSTSNTEKQQQQHSHFQQQQQQQRWHYSNSTLTAASLEGALPSVTVVKPRSTPNTGATTSNNRLAYVDALVDVNALVIELIWQLNPATTASNSKHASKNNVVVPLRTFIQEVLKRSRTTYSTLQTALFYLFRSRPEINNYLTRMQQQQQNNNNNWEYAYINCGRRMFLASLVVASKFVQDKTYRNSAWAKIAGLPVSEVNAAERIFLNMIDYRLYISQPKFEQWHHLLHMYVEAKTLNQPTDLHDLSTLPFAATNIDYYDHHHDNQALPSPRTTPPRSQQNYGWTLVLSPTSFLPPPHHHHQQHPAAAPLPPPINSHCECQSTTTTTTTTRLSKKRKTSSASASSLCSYPPVLSMSLPSSINSSPMQTPTQISPVRMNNGTSVFNWNSPTSFDHNILHQRSFVNTSTTNISNKKRKFASSVEPHSRSYNLSNVRQQANRFHS